MAGFKKATKKQSKLRMALMGTSGSGKTYTALKIAQELGQRVAVVDTEHGSASKYSGDFEFDVMELETFSPKNYIDAIKMAETEGYDVLVIDSLSHAWMGKEGALEMVDRAAKKSQSSNTFAAWRDVTPLHNQMIEAIIGSKLHIIVTMRAKTEYVIEQNERGRSAPRKVGLAPVQRDGMEYEFDVTAMLTPENDMIIEKTRCSLLTGKVFNRAGADVAAILRAWLTDGSPIVEQPALQFTQATDTSRDELLTKLKQERDLELTATGTNATYISRAMINDMTNEQIQAEIDATRAAILKLPVLEIDTTAD